MIDPVCGMSVSRSSEITTDYQGVPYYFCCLGCRDSFIRQPAAYLNSLAGLSPTIGFVARTKSYLNLYFPLVLILAYLLGTVLLFEFHQPAYSVLRMMNHFMGGFFLIFSFFKLLDLQAFAEAYRRYDILARRFPAYGWVYPFLELTLGMGYFSQGYPTILNAATLILMSLSSLGVAQSLLQGKKIECACLGTFFKLPMSQLTLFEDLVMAAMALICLIL